MTVFLLVSVFLERDVKLEVYVQSGFRKDRRSGMGWADDVFY